MPYIWNALFVLCIIKHELQEYTNVNLWTKCNIFSCLPYSKLFRQAILLFYVFSIHVVML